MDGSATFFLELGGIILVLGTLARMASAFGVSPIPLYLVAGLAFGEGGLVPLVTSQPFVDRGAQLGVILLLLMLGLEYTGDELVRSMRTTSTAGGVDLVANALPGYLVGLLVGFGPVGSLYLGGITYISSSGVVAKLLVDLGWTGNRETPVVLSVLVFEDLAMAVILPILGAVALGGSVAGVVGSVGAAMVAVIVILALASRHGDRLSRLAFSASDEVNLLTILGVTLIVAGVAEELHVSAAVGAFLVGIGVSGDAAHRARDLLSPLRDLFAAVFFVFFGLSTDPGSLPAVWLYVVALVVITGATKLWTGWWAAGRSRIGSKARLRAGAALLARGEFSIVIAELGVAAGTGARLGALAAGYVLGMATLGPIVARWAARTTRPS